MSFWQTIQDGIKTGVKKGTTALLGLLGATTATELIFYCAFKGAILGSTLGTLFPVIGNLAGFVVGAVLGGGLAGILIFLVYKGLIGIDKSLGKDNKSKFQLNDNPNEDLEYIEQIKTIKVNDYRNFLIAKTENLYQQNQVANISPEVTKLGVHEINDNFERDYAPIATRRMPHQFRSILPAPPAAVSNGQNNIVINSASHRGSQIPDDNQLNSDSTGLFSIIFSGVKKVYQFIKIPFTKFKTLFKIAGGAAAIGSIISCAYYGSMIGGTVGHAIPIPIVGPIIGYVSGGLLGAVIAGVLVFIVGKSIIKIDNVLSDKKEPEKATLKSQLIEMKNELVLTKQHFNVLKHNALRLVSLSQRVINARKLNNTAAQTNPEPSGTQLTASHSTELILATNRSSTATSHDLQLSRQTNSVNMNDKNEQETGFFASIKRFYNYIKKPTLLLVGVPASAVTILSCAYYGALMGGALGTAIPGLGNLAGLIIGGILGAAVAGGAIYLAANGLIELDKIITGQDEHTLLMNELEKTLNELRETNKEVQQLNNDLEKHKRLCQGLPEPSANRKSSDDSSALELITPAIADNDKDPLIENKNNETDSSADTGIFTSLKNNVVRFIDKIKTPVLAFLGGTAGLITIGTCAYYGAMIGGSVGTVFPGPGNIIGMVVGGLFGAIIGFGFVTLTAKLGIALHEKITHNKADAIAKKMSEINTENTKLNENQARLESNLTEMNEIWSDAFTERSAEKYQSCLSKNSSLGSSNHQRRFGKDAVNNNKSHSTTASISIPPPSSQSDQHATSHTQHSNSYSTSASVLLPPPRYIPPKPKDPPPLPPSGQNRVQPQPHK